LEIIVVNNNSTDNTAQTLEQLHVKTFFQPMETSTTMPRKNEAPIHRQPMPAPDTHQQQLLEAAWPPCGMIQDIIDRLNEAGSNTELRLLTNRLRRLVTRATLRRDFEKPAPNRP
jgi:hypothetical protein